MENPIFNAAGNRLQSPILGPITLSWCLWNWEVLVYLFKMDMDPKVKIETIKAMIGTLHGIILPLVSMFFVSFVLPWIEVKYGKFTNWIIKLAEIRDHNHKLQLEIDREMNHAAPKQLIISLWESIQSLKAQAIQTRKDINDATNNLDAYYRPKLEPARASNEALVANIQAAIDNHEYLKNSLGMTVNPTFSLSKKIDSLKTRIQNLRNGTRTK